MSQKIIITEAAFPRLNRPLVIKNKNNKDFKQMTLLKAQQAKFQKEVKMVVKSN